METRMARFMTFNFKKRWRIVADNYAGYEVQCRHWWWPFWSMHGKCNTFVSVPKAEEYIKHQLFVKGVNPDEL